MLKRFGAVALLLGLFVPGLGHAATMTASPANIIEGTGPHAISLFYNATLSGSTGLSFAVASSGTTTITGIANGTDEASLGCGTDLFNPNNWAASGACSSPGSLTSGTSYNFAILTVNAGAIGDDIVLTSGTAFIGLTSFNMDNNGQVIVTIDPVPEPGALVLLGAGLAGLAFLRRREA
jgi:hypothetical protein